MKRTLTFALLIFFFLFLFALFDQLAGFLIPETMGRLGRNLPDPLQKRGLVEAGIIGGGIILLIALFSFEMYTRKA